ncbi:c-type cytochrome [Rhodoferax antarcticus]|uniref:Cytochrome c, class I n=1 Tax=Rhodoferax antarcticus ANT.BR TaxID=1111071 RepID=A0A1Q8YEH1_9BURK|nr:c-type cytochrome [Rhodoferax antarcticus]APW46258.1 cytochrome C' [Rhodoferax antarcticus]MCW2313071.1 cytochrome c [Rhodoferax antarcticus]OLP06464.1 Cytochrome c, class I [Rhodoferax antarcticus ANT.BR]
MKRPLLALLTGVFLAAPALADQALAEKKRCTVCHTVSQKILGPAYKDVAARYAGQNASTELANKIIHGGGGVWGVVPMPANPKISRSDAETLARWILSLK